MKKHQNFIGLTAVMILAAVCRFFLLFRDLEYDEIWNLENYAGLPLGEIFSQLATPNNHPVNTVLIKLLHFSSEYAWTIRLGSLLFSLGSVVLLYLLGKSFFRDRGAWYAAIAGAVLPPLINFGTTARGYAGQFFFLLLFSYALIKCRKGSAIWTLTAAISGLLAILSLQSSILYIVPAGILFLIYLWKKKRWLPIHLLTFSIMVILTGIWFGINFHEFTRNTQFKVVVDSRQSFYNWFNSALILNGIPWWLLPLPLFFKRKRKAAFILLILIFFPLAAAIFTTPAPARVYLPGAAAGILLFTPMIIKDLKYFILGSAAVLTLQIIISYPIIQDLRVIQEMLDYQEVSGIITVYGANESYPISRNHKDSIELFFRQMQKASTMKKCMLLLSENKLSGVDQAGNTILWDIPENTLVQRENRRAPMLASLIRTTEVPADTIAFAIYPPRKEAAYINNIKYLQAKELIYLNRWLTIPLRTANGDIHRYALVAFKIGRARKFHEAAPIFVFAIEK